MLVVDGPPPPNHLIIGRCAVVCVATCEPGLVRANEMHQVYAGLEVTIGRNVLVVRRRSDVVCKAQAIEAVLEVHVEQSLISTVERDASFSHGHQGIVVTHVWRQDHDARIEDVGPANVGRSGKGMLDVEQLVRSSVCKYIGVNVDNFGELKLPPKVDLGKCRVQIGSVHEVEVGRVVISNSRDG
jgi:hypothetical protein